MSSMSMIEWPDWDCCFVISVRWIVSCLTVLSEVFAKRALSFTCVLFFALSEGRRVTFYMMSYRLVSPALMKVYDGLPLSMYGQVRHLCLELQRNVPAGVSGELSVFASFARTSKSRRLGERRRKATIGTSL